MSRWNRDRNLTAQEKYEEELLHRLYQQLWEQFKSVSNVNVTQSEYRVRECFREFLNSQSVRDPSMCPVKFDGVSCWPQTPLGTIRAIPCIAELNGIAYNTSENATLYCRPNGTWDEFSHYHNCIKSQIPMTGLTSIGDVDAIALIFYIGHVFSLVAVILALSVFVSLKDLRCLRNTIHANLLATYLLHNLFWILSASIQTYVNVKINCSLFVTLEYFILTNFMWMFVEGLYLYVLVVKTFSVENIKLRIYMIIGWGIPIPVIVAWILTRTQLSLRKFSTVPYGGLYDDELEGLMRKCPLVIEDHTDWIKRAPVLLVLSANIVFLIQIMWVLITKLRSANNAEIQMYRKATKALLVLIPLLGLTYVLLIALPSELEHMRAILLSTQGFWVALFYCFLNSEVQNSIRHHIERWKVSRGVDNRALSVRHGRDGSPRPKEDRSFQKKFFGRKKRESLYSEVTTMTTFVVNTNGYSSFPHGNSNQRPSTSNSASVALLPAHECVPHNSPVISSACDAVL